MTTTQLKTRLAKVETYAPPSRPRLCLLGASREDFDRQIAEAGDINGREVTEIWLVGKETE